MSTDASNAELRKQKYTEFMHLLPLTIAIAGLPEAEQGKYFNEGQMENRAISLKQAYKIARGIVRDITA